MIAFFAQAASPLYDQSLQSVAECLQECVAKIFKTGVQVRRE